MPVCIPANRLTRSSHHLPPTYNNRHPIHTSQSSHWILPKRLTWCDTPQCWRRWQNSICRNMCTTGWSSEHSHCTVYNGQTSTVKKITASIIQSPGIGPAAFTAGYLTVTDPGNKLVKFADDTCLVIPATSASTRSLLQRLRTMSCGLKVTICPSTDPKPEKLYSAI